MTNKLLLAILAAISLVAVMLCAVVLLLVAQSPTVSAIVRPVFLPVTSLFVDCKRGAVTYHQAIQDPIVAFIGSATALVGPSEAIQPSNVGGLLRAKADFEALPFPYCVTSQRVAIQLALGDVITIFTVGTNGAPGQDRVMRSLAQITEADKQIEAAGR